MFRNVYADGRRARSYADLEFPGTYYLGFRDLPELIARHVSGSRALDFGCGAGRSSRFLRGLHFDVVGVDISEEMIRQAGRRDSEGDYRLIPPGDLSALAGERFDLVLCAYTFDNVQDIELRRGLFAGFRDLLSPGGRIINLVSAPEIYVHEWVSFTTRDFPENADAKSGELVRIVMLDVEDQRPVEDAFWTDDDYRDLFDRAGLRVLEKHQPLGVDSDPFTWLTETRISPWAIYVLGV